MFVCAIFSCLDLEQDAVDVCYDDAFSDLISAEFEERGRLPLDLPACRGVPQVWRHMTRCQRKPHRHGVALRDNVVDGELRALERCSPLGYLLLVFCQTVAARIATVTAANEVLMQTFIQYRKLTFVEPFLYAIADELLHGGRR